MVNTWDSYCVTPEEEGSGTKVLDANENVQPTVEAGSNIVIENGQISASGTLENVQANWQTVDSDDPSYIRNKPQNLVQDADYVHIDNNFTDADVSKLEGIEAGAQVNVKPDWDAVAGSDAEILNKPTIPTVDQVYNSSSTNAQSGVAVSSAVSGAISGVRQVPNSISTDAGKVLKVNAQGAPEWGADNDTTYSAGNGLSLNGTEFSVDTSVVATQNDLSDYQPVISDLDSIRSGASAGATAVQPGSLATVATSGSYDDLTDKPTIPPGIVVDQVYDATSSNAQSGTAVAGAIGNVKQVPSSTAGDSGKVLKVNSSGNAVWDTETGTTYSAGTGIDITGTTISVDSTVRSGAAAGATAVQPGSLATVATSGSYADLSNKPTIPTVDQSYGASSTNAQSGTAVAGAIATVRQVPSTTSSDNGKVLGVTNAQGTLGWVAQPTVPTSKPLVAGSNITITENANDVTISAAGGSTVTVDQVYSASSTNAQSGTAVAGAISGKQDTISDLQTIRSGASAGATAVQPGSLATVATSGSYTDLSNKPTIPTVDQSYGASSTNAQSGTAVAGAIATKQDIISDLATIRSGAAAGATAVQPSSLATVATSGSYADLSNKPTIPTVDQNYSASSTNAQSGTAVASALNTVRQLPVTSSADATKMLTVNTYGMPAWAYPPKELPSLTGNSSKVLAVNSGATGVEWVTPQGGTSYTAGDAIDISNAEISVNHDSTLSVTQSASGSATSVGSNLYYAWADNYAYKSLRLTVPAGLSTAATVSFAWNNNDHVNSHGSPDAEGGKAFLVLANPSDSTKYVVGTGLQGTWRDATEWDASIYLPLTWSGTLASMFTWGQLSMDDLRDSNGNVDVYICCTNYSGTPVSGNAPGGYFNTIYMAAESDYGDEGSVISFSYSLVGNKLTVVNPVPAYAAGDANKVLTVNAGGTGTEWTNFTQIEVVASMPAAPTSGVLYIVTGA